MDSYAELSIAVETLLTLIDINSDNIHAPEVIMDAILSLSDLMDRLYPPLN